MPRRFERHRKGKDVYDTQPARSAELAQVVTEPAKRPPGRKDTRAWCRGKVGREHVPGVAFRPPVFTERTCGWQPRWGEDGVYWRCHHQEECSACGKVLRSGPKFSVRECPDYPGSGEQRREAERGAAASRERWSAWRRRQQRAITGPQGYRRRRPDGG